MFHLSRFWERVFFVLTFVTQGASYLDARPYALLHRMHHAYSDTEKDPHSPHYFGNVFGMMWRTAQVYHGLLTGKLQPEERFTGDLPDWPAFSRFARGVLPRAAWTGLYVLYYVRFATAWWMYLLLPIHVLMGPIHGAMVNWCAHKYGYRNFDDTDDRSVNSLPIDFLGLGELFQNNHHKYPERLNFRERWFELDPAYPLIVLLEWMRVIRRPPQGAST